MSILREGAEVTVAAKPVSVDEASRLGLLSIGDDARITEFVEKPTDPDIISNLVLRK